MCSSDLGTDVNIPVEAMAKKLDDVLAGNIGASVSAPAAAPVMPTPSQTQATAPVTPATAPATEAPAPQLGEILVNEGLATKEQVFDALTAQSKQGDAKQPLGELLIQAKAITEKALDQALQKQEKPSKGEEDATIRVETRRLDSVMNLVGELVLGRNRLIKIGGVLEQDRKSTRLNSSHT